MSKVKLGWYKLNKKAIIPTKTEDNAGFDIYTIEEDFILEPHTNHLFSTGLSAVVEKGWWLMAADRGSNGSKNAHIHCGIIDNNYRGEIFICLNNDNDYPIKFTNKEPAGFHSHKETVQDYLPNSLAYRLKEIDIIDYLVYPVSKGIAQIVLIPQPEVENYEMSEQEWNDNKDTSRGAGKLGSTGK